MNCQENAAFLGSSFAWRHGFKVNWICFPPGAVTVLDGSGMEGWSGQKNGNDIFQTGQIQHLHIDFRDESQIRCCCGETGPDCKTKNLKRLVICPQLKSVTFTKRAKMPDCCMCSQQFTIKRGVTQLRVSQLSEKETKWLPWG
jgi:hypothetical protein